MSLGQLLRLFEPGEDVHDPGGVLSGWEHGRGYVPPRVLLRGLQHSRQLYEHRCVLPSREHGRGHLSLGQLLRLPERDTAVHD